jgi:hypothetical protein
LIKFLFAIICINQNFEMVEEDVVYGSDNKVNNKKKKGQ